MNLKKSLKKAEHFSKFEFRYKRAKHILRSKGYRISKLRKVYDAFDDKFYVNFNPELRLKKKDAFIHFMTEGWKQGLNPSPYFNTKHYIESHNLSLEGDANPFIEWVLHPKETPNTGNSAVKEGAPVLDNSACEEQKYCLPTVVTDASFNPLVTVIIPNYNHADYLQERIESILNQSYENFELLILDDVSKDSSREVIQSYADKYPDKIRTLFNETNSGNVFKQWKKGIQEAKGELIWICESDDFCDKDLLKHLTPYFYDSSVTLSFGRIQFANHDGSLLKGADHYRENAEAGIWNSVCARSAPQWFQNGFGVNNIIPNVGGCLFRNHKILDAVWEKATSFSILGDWYLYLQIAGAGNIVYEPEAVAYFRQHKDNTSVLAFKKKSFYLEHHQFMIELCKKWDIPSQTIAKFSKGVKALYEHQVESQEFGKFEDFFDETALQNTRRENIHINLAFLGFHVGGGELFPINLANAYYDLGYNISMTAFDLTIKAEQMVNALNPNIPVYSCQLIAPKVETFAEDHAIDIIHSHMVCLDSFFLEDHTKPNCKYVVSLHGSYEACDVEDSRIDHYFQQTDQFYYTADRNLLPFKDRDFSESHFLKMPNAMPYDEREYPQSRQDLGITDDAVVFTLVARGIKRKGWRASINAFVQLLEEGTDAHLLLCGDGDIVQELKETHEKNARIHFLGFQSCIHGLYRMSDVALIPTRYQGESYPLCLIQAIQCNIPVISTGIGEIENIVKQYNAGIALDEQRSTKAFTDSLAKAMALMIEKDNRYVFKPGLENAKLRFNIYELAKTFRSKFDQLLEAP